MHQQKSNIFTLMPDYPDHDLRKAYLLNRMGESEASLKLYNNMLTEKLILDKEVSTSLEMSEQEKAKKYYLSAQGHGNEDAKAALEELG